MHHVSLSLPHTLSLVSLSLSLSISLSLYLSLSLPARSLVPSQLLSSLARESTTLSTGAGRDHEVVRGGCCGRRYTAHALSGGAALYAYHLAPPSSLRDFSLQGHGGAGGGAGAFASSAHPRGLPPHSESGQSPRCAHRAWTSAGEIFGRLLWCKEKRRRLVEIDRSQRDPHSQAGSGVLNCFVERSDRIPP